VSANWFLKIALLKMSRTEPSHSKISDDERKGGRYAITVKCIEEDTDAGKHKKKGAVLLVVALIYFKY